MSNFQVQIVSLDEDTSEFTAKSTFDHPYPTTKIMWIPDAVSILGVLRNGINDVWGRRGRDCMVVGFTTTCTNAISAYHH